jgi:GNAT superfamily N-acetyltransferase
MSLSNSSYVGKSGVRLHAPAGFYFKITPGDYGFTVSLYKRRKRSNKMVGYIKLERHEIITRNKFILETHSWLAPRLRGKGIGSLMYARAIQYALDHGHRVQSSGLSSDFAVRVWEGHYLRKHFKIKEERSNWSGWLWKAYAKRKSSKANARHLKNVRQGTRKHAT